MNKCLEKNIVINENSEVFKGHFPDSPIFPGVLLIALARNFVEKHLLLTDSPQILKAKKIKFLKPVLPGDNLKLEVYQQQNPKETISYQYEFYSKDFKITSGILEYKMA